MWPMPLPFPFCLMHTSSDSPREQFAFQKGINLAVAMLNWLHLKRPSTCPLEIVLHVPLSRLQWKVVRHLESTMAAWRDLPPLSSANLGRATDKVESIDRVLSQLASFEESLQHLFEETLPDFSAAVPGPAGIRYFSPGLQASSGGDVVGRISLDGSTVAKPIIASRLEFKGEPIFDPSPFLDDRCRFIFQDPLNAAMKPEKSTEEIPAVRLFGAPDELWKLFRKLDAT